MSKLECPSQKPNPVFQVTNQDVNLIRDYGTGPYFIIDTDKSVSSPFKSEYQANEVIGNKDKLIQMGAIDGKIDQYSGAMYPINMSQANKYTITHLKFIGCINFDRFSMQIDQIPPSRSYKAAQVGQVAKIFQRFLEQQKTR